MTSAERCLTAGSRYRLVRQVACQESATANNNTRSTPASPEYPPINTIAAINTTAGPVLSSTERFNTIMIKNVPNKYTPVGSVALPLSCV